MIIASAPDARGADKIAYALLPVSVYRGVFSRNVLKRRGNKSYFRGRGYLVVLYCGRDTQLTKLGRDIVGVSASKSSYQILGRYDYSMPRSYSPLEALRSRRASSASR